LKIQLFNPPFFHYGDLQYKMLPGLGLPILSAVLNKAGHYCEVFDLEAMGIDPHRLQRAFEAQRQSWPDVVGITSLNIGAQGARELVHALRAAGFDRRIVIGGAHATAVPDECLAWGADLVVVGECEGNIVELLESGATGIQQGKAAPIESIPLPDWDNYRPGLNAYEGNMRILRDRPGISMWSRGCPYQCIFCSDIVFNHQPTRYRPPAVIEEEMVDLKKRGCRNIYVYDDELVGTRMPAGWLHDIADRIEPLGLSWVTQGRCSRKYITPEIMQDLKRAGCRMIFWGIESFSPKVLKAMKKHLDPADVFHTLRVAHDAGIENGIFTMIGNYLETEDDLQMTYDGLSQLYKDGLVQYRQTTVCTVMPGTELERIQQREGWYHAAPMVGTNHHQAGSGTPWLTAHQIELWQRRFSDACPVGMP
jgi:anaerobic magnesium-protoporphyrin IX monomethyl ester cyclase